MVLYDRRLYDRNVKLDDNRKFKSVDKYKINFTHVLVVTIYPKTDCFKNRKTIS